VKLPPNILTINIHPTKFLLVNISDFTWQKDLLLPLQLIFLEKALKFEHPKNVVR
jgi:hypothetical protein